LAYHFEFNEEEAAGGETSEAIANLREAILGWHAAVGTAGFVKLERGGSVWLYDTRPGAHSAESFLEGAQATAYRLMEAGCTRERLGTQLGLDPSAVGDLVGAFLEQRWIAELDGKCLSLAVPVDAEVSETVPEELQGSVATALYHHRMDRLWQVVRN
jgi:hypothetical protein